ncbi:Hsp70 family protein [uncultured Thermomonospora sp.]|uniref:Hsp70 family protein n=1 Tax=uncultured Thermomonospora sp. TaxID=671175 RepID=UPI00259BAB8F|nr:Hsp70 family protein [uncultured Thermomonospora sp.]
MTAYGIDLGTTNSCIAYIDESGRAVVARNVLGKETTPSVVYFERAGRVVIGEAAKNSALLVPHLVIQSIKRQMGRPDVEYVFHGERFTPEKISALLLRRLAEDAERRTGEPVREVVITVPAYFGVPERTATRRAGEIAGLNVVDLLDEPVAAALARLARQPAWGERHLLVYDLGGGTFDTTVIRVAGPDIKVICTGGELGLGGADWDARISEFLTAAFTEQTGLDPTADEQFKQELQITAEQLKHELSSTVRRHRNLRFGGAVARVELTRERLEELTADLLDRTMQITVRTVEKAQAAGVDRIDEVVLVGGMTKMPVIAERLEKLLGLRPTRHEPDLAVARGAALFALTRRARTGGGRSGGGAEEVADRLGVTAAEAGALVAERVTGVIPRGIGVKAVDPKDPRATTDPMRARSYIVHLLPAGTPLPAATGPVTIGTFLDNQPGVEIEVWEQKSPDSSTELADNTLVGRGLLHGLPPGLPKGSPIQLDFAMDETGLLTVHAKEPTSGREVRFELRIGGMDADAVDAARASVARYQTTL